MLVSVGRLAMWKVRARLTDEYLVGGGVGAHLGVLCRELFSIFTFRYGLEPKERLLTTISQDGTTAISDEGESGRKAGNSSDRSIN